MRVSLIAAMAENRVIGRNNQLPWRLSADLKHFRKVTTGKPVIMGRNTHDSIGRPLPDRVNIVITGDTQYQADGCVVVHAIDAALVAAGNVEEVMIMGGAQLYVQTLERADRLYLTLVHAEIDGDVLFPDIDWGQWQAISAEHFKADENNEFDYSFCVFDRLRKKG